MIDHVLDNLAPIGGIDRVYVVTNAKFAGHFQKWADGYRTAKLNFTVVNDGSTDDSNRLGAIGDLNLVLTRENVDDDIIVVAGDNLFSERLDGFGKFCREKNAPVLGVYDVGSLDEARKYGVVSLDGTGKITSFEEKPPQPQRARSPASRFIFIRKQRCRSSSNTSPKATIPISRAASCNGFIRARRFTPGACPACGSTSARRRRWKKRTGFLRGTPFRAQVHRLSPYFFSPSFSVLLRSIFRWWAVRPFALARRDLSKPKPGEMPPRARPTPTAS